MLGPDCRQARCDISTPPGRCRYNLKIERQSDGETTIICLIGRIRAGDLEELRAQTDGSPEDKVFDLSEVTIVDADVIRFLSAREAEGIQLVHCPPYIREWILREREEGEMSEL